MGAVDGCHHHRGRASLSLKAALEPLTWIMTAGIVLIIGGVLLIEVGSAAS